MPHTVLLAESKAIVHKSNYLYVLIVIRPLVQTAAGIIYRWTDMNINGGNFILRQGVSNIGG